MQSKTILAHGSRTSNYDSQINTPLYPLWPPTGQRNLQEPPLSTTLAQKQDFRHAKDSLQLCDTMAELLYVGPIFSFSLESIS